MKVKRFLKRATSLLLCVVTVLTTIDLTALTTNAGQYYGENTVISGNGVFENGQFIMEGDTVSGDDILNPEGNEDEISNPGDNNDDEDISSVSDNDTEDESVSDNDADDTDDEDADDEDSASVSDNDAESVSDNDIESISENSVSDNSVSENSVSDNDIEETESEKWTASEVTVNLETVKPESVSLNSAPIIVSVDNHDEYFPFDHSDTEEADYSSEIVYSDTDSFTVEYTDIDEDTISVRICFDLRMRPLYIEDSEGNSLYDSENDFDNEDLLGHLRVVDLPADSVPQEVSMVAVPSDTDDDTDDEFVSVYAYVYEFTMDKSGELTLNIGQERMLPEDMPEGLPIYYDLLMGEGVLEPVGASASFSLVISEGEEIPYLDWKSLSAAIAAINNPLADVKVYIKCRKVDAQTGFKFPKAAASITFITPGGAFPGADVYYSADITIGCDTTFNDMRFIKIKNTGKPLDFNSLSDEELSALKVSPYTLSKVDINGYKLNFWGNEDTFSTALNITDSKKTGTLSFGSWTKFYTLQTDEPEGFAEEFVSDDTGTMGSSYVIINGSITNVGNIELKSGQIMVVSDYLTGSGSACKLNAPGFTPVNVVLEDNSKVYVANYLASFIENYPNEFKNDSLILKAEEVYKSVTSANISGTVMAGNNSCMVIRGALTLNNLTLAGRGARIEASAEFNDNIFAKQATIIEAGTTFNIKGTLVSEGENNSLYTDNDSKDIPFLNVSGSVSISAPSNRILIYNYQYVHKNTDGPKYSGTEGNDSILLTCKNGSIDCFAPYYYRFPYGDISTSIPADCIPCEGLYNDYYPAETYEGCMMSSANPDGYYLKKTGEKIYVISGKSAVVAVAKVDGEPYYKDDNGSAFANANGDATNPVIGVYSSWADAVVAVNNLKDDSQSYEFILLKDIGGTNSENKPITLNFPTSTCIDTLYVVGSDYDETGELKCIYYTNGLTLTSDIVFNDIIFCQLKSASGGYTETQLGINASAYDITFVHAKICSWSNENNQYIASYFGNITGNGYNTITVDKLNHEYYGSALYEVYSLTGISNIGTLNLADSEIQRILGNVSVGTLNIDNECDVYVTGNVTATTITVANRTGLYAYGNIQATTIYNDHEIEAGYKKTKTANLTTTDYYGDDGSRVDVNGNMTVTNGEIDVVSIVGTFTSKGSIRIFSQGFLGANKVYSKDVTLLSDSACIAPEISITGDLVMLGNCGLGENEGSTKLEIKNLSTYSNGSYTSDNYIVYTDTVTPKITGTVDTSEDKPILFILYGDKAPECLTADSTKNYKITPGTNNLVANIGSNPSKYFTYSIGTNYYSDFYKVKYENEDGNYQLVKYNGGLYILEINWYVEGNLVTVAECTGGTEPIKQSVCLDWNEAIREINNRNNSGAEYVIKPYLAEEYVELKDFCLTDDKKYGSLTLPTAKKYSKLYIEGGKDKETGEDKELKLDFNNTTVTLTGDVVFKNIQFNPVKNDGKESSFSFNTGSYYLEFNKVKALEYYGGIIVLTNITGSSVTSTTSQVVIKDCESEVTLGNIKNIGNLTISGNTNLKIAGEGNIGNLNIADSDSILRVKVIFSVGKDKKIKSITPKVTVNGQMSGNGKIDYFSNLNELDYDYKDLNKYRLNIGINIIKAPKASIGNIKSTGGYSTGNKFLVKKGDYIAYIEKWDRDIPYQLYYCNDNLERGDLIALCPTFADAVSVINNLNDKTKNYTIVFNGDDDDKVNAYTSPENYTMPAAGKYNILNITTAPSNHKIVAYYGTGTCDKIGSLSKMAFTGTTIIENVVFVDALAYKKGFENNDDKCAYGSALSISLGGNDVTFDNVVIAGRGVVIDGGKTGTLSLEGSVILGDCTKATTINAPGALPLTAGTLSVAGELKNLKELKIKEYANLNISGYIASSNGNTVKPGVLSATDFTVKGNKVFVDGSATFTNVYGVNSTHKNIINVKNGDFKITGTVSVTNSEDLLLAADFDHWKNTTRLTLSGVVGENSAPVMVAYTDQINGTYDIVTAIHDCERVSLINAPKCDASDFVAVNIVLDDHPVLPGEIYQISAVKFDPTKDFSERGIALSKENNVIKAYDGALLHVGLAVDLQVETEDGKNIVPVGKLNGCFKSVNDAITAINNMNDKTKEYTIVLFDNQGDEKTTITIPGTTKAKAISIRSLDSSKPKTLTLKSLAVTNDVIFDYINVDVETTITSSKNMTLTLGAGTTGLTVKGSATFENIKCTGDNTLTFSRTSANASQLKINGTLDASEASDTPEIVMNVASGKTAVSYTVDDPATKIKNDTLLFTAPLVSTNEIIFKINEGNDSLVKISNTEADYKDATMTVLVKSGNGFYAVKPNNDIRAGFTKLEKDGKDCGFYLDLNQALSQIDTYNDVTAKYVVKVVGEVVVGGLGQINDISDVNVTDKDAHSSLKMPGNNKAAAIKISRLGTSGTPSIFYNGDITAYAAGNTNKEGLIFEYVNLWNVKKNADLRSIDDTDLSYTGKITLNRNSSDKSGNIVTLKFSNVSLQGFDKISGSKNITNVYYSGGDVLRLKGGFSNVNLEIRNAVIIINGTSTIGELYLNSYNKASKLVSYGMVTVDTVKSSYYMADTVENQTGIYIKSPDKFKINGAVSGVMEKDYPIVVGFISDYMTFDNDVTGQSVKDSVADYLDKNLITAPNAEPASFTSYATYRNNNYASHKSGNYIRIGEKANMNVKVSVLENNTWTLRTYAKNYAEAVANINAWKNKDAIYSITFLTTGDVYTTANETPGAFTTPNAGMAAKVFVSGIASDKNSNGKIDVGECTNIVFTGTIKPNVNITFSNIVLDCEKKNKTIYEYSDMAIDLSTASLDIGSKVWSTNKDGSISAGKQTIYVSSVKGTKGTLILDNNVEINASDVISIGRLEIDKNATIVGLKGVTIGDVVGLRFNGGTYDDETISCVLNVTSVVSSSPLKITGKATNMAGIMINAYKKNDSGEIALCSATDLNKLLTTGAETSAELGKKKIAEMPYIPTEIVSVTTKETTEHTSADVYANNDDGNKKNIQKTNGCFYVTERPLIVSVDSATHNTAVYSKFVSFADAVADIDKRNDKTMSYTIELLANDGVINERTQNQIGAVTLPKNAADIDIVSNGGTCIYTTSASVTVNVPTYTTCEFVTVKQKSYDKVNGYYYEEATTPIAFSIGNNVSLNINTDQKVSKISGGELIVWYANLEVTAGLTVKKLSVSGTSGCITSNNKITITSQNETAITNSGSVEAPYANVSFKKTTISGGSITAANVTLTGDTLVNGLKKSEIYAIGAASSGQGKISIQNIKLIKSLDLNYKVDASGKGQLSITGDVTRTGSAQINLKTFGKNTDYGKYLSVKGTDAEKSLLFKPVPGTVLLSAPKVTNDNVTVFIMDNNCNPLSGYGPVKSGTNVAYMKTAG